MEQLEARALLSASTAELPTLFGPGSGDGVSVALSESDTPTTITTDKDDYAPGETVVITGGGFLPGETVQLEIDHVDGTPTDGPQHEPWTVEADELGNVTATWAVLPHELNHTLLLTATGLTSGRQATREFTDATHLQSVSVGTQTGNLTQGAAGSATFAISGSFNGSGGLTAVLSISGLPSGATAGFSPTSISDSVPNATLTITTTAGLASGSYTFTVTANGGPSDTKTATGTLVVKASTSTTLTSNLNPSTYGQSVSFTATVSAADATTPGGSVQFKDGATVLSTQTLSGGSASFSTSALTASGSPHSITAVYVPDATHTASTSAALCQTVNKAVLTVKANAATRQYGNANPSLSATITGFVNGQTLATSGVTGSASVTTAATPTTAAGTIPITVTTGTLAASNYSFTFVDDFLTITKATLTVTANAASRTYGDANPTFTANITGFKNSETLNTSDVTGSPSLTTTATAATNAGTAAITAAVGTLASNNYSFAFTSGTLTINKAVLTVTADPASRTYGDANPAFTASYSGFKNGQVIGTSGVTGSPSLTTTANAATNAGTATITAANGSLASTNYSFSFVNGTLTINKAVLTVMANAASRTYGAANPSFTAGFTGFKNGQNLASSGVTGAASLTTTATPASPVGPYTISAAVGTLAATNYSFSFVDGTLTVNKAVLTVTADAASRVYGDPNPLFTASYSGFQNGEILATSGVAGSPSLTTTATAATNVGSASIVAAAGSLTASNYSFSFVNGTLTITQATLSVVVDDQSKVYGEANPTLTGTVSGVKNGDNITASYSTTATQFSDAGGYSITATLNDPNGKLGNYTVSNTAGTLTINKADQVITWANPADITYGTALGAAQLNATVAGVAGGSAAGALTYTPAAGTVLNAGNGQTLSVSAAATTNYNAAAATVIINVNKAALVVTADDKSRAKGAGNPATSYTVFGLVSGDSTTGAPTITMPTVGTGEVGVFPIAIAAGSFNAGANYNVTFVPGKLTVTGVQINDGEAQRSMIRSIKVTFADPMAGTPTLSLIRRTGGAVMPLTSVLSDGNQTITYTFAIGSSPALIDGIYDLSVTAGPQSQSLTFHRLFGDANGDKKGDAADIAAFAAAMKPGAGYTWYFDNDNDSDVDAADYTQARARQGKIYVY